MFTSQSTEELCSVMKETKLTHVIPRQFYFGCSQAGNDMGNDMGNDTENNKEPEATKTWVRHSKYTKEITVYITYFPCLGFIFPLQSM